MKSTNYNVKELVKNKPIILAIVSFLITISIAVNVYILYMDIESARELKNTRLNNISLFEWSYIETVMYDNKEKAAKQGELISAELRNKIKESYGDNSKLLLHDMNNITSNSLFIQDVSTVLEGKYINVNNDNNDPFIAIHKVTSDVDSSRIPLKTELSAIIGDKSLNCSANGNEIRNWATEIKLHSNKQLAVQAIRGILNQNQDLLFWQFLPDITENNTINAMEAEELKNKFLKYGLRGLYPYEILTPTYVEPTEDILGNPYVGTLGNRNDAYMIIVNQGFSLYDALKSSTRHMEVLNRFESEKRIIEREFNTYKTNKTLIIMLEVVMMLILFVSIATIQRQLTVEDVVTILSRDDGEEYDDNGDRD